MGIERVFFVQTQALHVRRTTFTTKLKGRAFDSAGEGGLAVFIESEYLFPIFCGDNIYFYPTSAQTVYHVAYLNLMDAGLFINFFRNLGQNIYN